jgi:hypothetical protein
MMMTTLIASQLGGNNFIASLFHCDKLFMALKCVLLQDTTSRRGLLRAWRRLSACRT